MSRRKILPTPILMRVEDVIKDYNSKKMAIVKSFQRRQVWDRKTTNEYIESVSEGTAVSGLIVANIESGLEVSNGVGKEEYQKLFDKGFRTINEDGQNRLTKLISFVNNEISFTGVLYDEDNNPREFINVKFEKLPKSFQTALKGSHVVMVEIKNAPYHKLPQIFRKLNSGMALNRTELRQSFQTPISDWIRKHCEGDFEDMWPQFNGCSEKAILRMRDIEWMSQALMSVNSFTRTHRFLDSDLDDFYQLGIGKPISKVEEYDQAELDRFITILKVVQKAVNLQTYHPPSKNVPQKTFWALLFVAERLYDEGWQIHNYHQFYTDVYTLDCKMESDSKVQQVEDLAAAKVVYPHLDDDEIKKKVPDNNYYWRWCNRTEIYAYREKRKLALCDEFENRMKSGQVSSIVVSNSNTSVAAK